MWKFFPLRKNIACSSASGEWEPGMPFIHRIFSISIVMTCARFLSNPTPIGSIRICQSSEIGNILCFEIIFMTQNNTPRMFFNVNPG